MSVFSTGHQRNNSAGEHLINSNNADDFEAGSPYIDTVMRQPYNSMRYTAAPSDDRSSYYRPASENTADVEYTGCLCKDAHLRANIRVIVGSILLTVVGIILFVFGFLIMVIPNEIDVHGWIFCLVGVLFFIPGVYHLIYITCTVMGRPGYSFDNLSTFRRPPA